MATAVETPLKNVKLGCICPNEGRAGIDGVRVINPCCKIHYAERTVCVATPDRETEITRAEIAEWKRREKKRVAYPKMTVARR